MVVPRRWRFVSGGVVAAVALGSGAALAHDGSGEVEVPTLQDVVRDVSAVTVTSIGLDDIVVQADEEPVTLNQDASPFSEMSPESQIVETVSPPTQTVDVETVSPPSPPTVETATVESPESPSIPSPETND